MKISAFIVLALATVIIAAPTEYKYDENSAHPSASKYTDGPTAPPIYTFDYGVKNETIELGHSESRNKDGVKGTYYVTLPDGRQQVVKYIVDGDLGYVATVDYYGEAENAVRDESDPQVWPQYEAPKPKPEYQPKHEYNWSPYPTTESTPSITIPTNKYAVQPVVVQPEPNYEPMKIETKYALDTETSEEADIYAASYDMQSVTIRLFRDDIGPIKARNRNYQPRPATVPQHSGNPIIV